MVREWLSYVHAGFFCPINHVTKVLPEAVTKQFLQVAALQHSVSSIMQAASS